MMLESPYMHLGAGILSNSAAILNFNILFSREELKEPAFNYVIYLTISNNLIDHNQWINRTHT